MKKLLPSLFIVFFAIPVSAQKWKEYYDSAVILENKNDKSALDLYLLAKISLPKDSAKTITNADISYDIAYLYHNSGRYNEAEPLYLETKNIYQNIFGKEYSTYSAICINLAFLYKAMDKPVKAEPFFEEAKSMREKTLGKDHPKSIDAENYLADFYFDSRQYEKAEPLYLELTNIREKALGKEHADYVLSLIKLALLYDYSRQYKKSEILYLQAKNIREKTLGKNSLGYANSCNSLASLYMDMREYKNAEPLFLEAKKIREDILGKEHTDYAASVYNLASLYKDMGEYKKAELLFLEAKSLQEKTTGKEDVSYADLLTNLAIVYRQMALYQKAEPLYLEVKIIREKIQGKEHPDYAGAITNLALLYDDMGLYSKAESLYIEAKDLKEKIFGKNDPEYASALHNLATFYHSAAQYEKAEQLYLEAKNIREKILGKGDADYASTIEDLATLYSNMGQYEKAEQLYREAKDIKEKIWGKQHPYYAALLTTFGVFYLDRQEYGKAEPFLIEAKTITENIFGKSHPLYADILNNLAMLYQDIKQYEKSEAYYVEAKNIREKIFGKLNPNYAASLNNLAILYKLMEKYDKAEPLYLEAKDIRAKTLGKEHPDYGASLQNLAMFYWLNNKPLQADTLFREQFSNKYHQVKKILQFTGEKEKTAFIANIFGSNDFYNSFYYQTRVQNSGVMPFTTSFLSRNLILSSSAELRKLINNSNDPNALAVYGKWDALKKQLAVFYSKGKNDVFVKGLEDSADVLEKDLSRISSEFKKVQADKTWQNIQSGLKDNETAIEFSEFNYFDGKRWTDSTFYVALVLRKDRPEPVMVPLFEKKELDNILLQTGNKTTNDNVKNLYASRGAGSEDSVVMNRSLYKLVWGALERELTGIKTIYFAPAGLLHRIAFAALPVDDKKVLSDEYRLIELSTTASIADQKPSYISTSDKIVLYGGIKYNADTTALKTFASAYHVEKTTTRSLPDDISRGSAWNDLPGTKKETDEIVSVADRKNNVSVVTGIQATEESIKALDGKNSPVVLHIATHGFFFPDPKRDKKDELANTENGSAFKQSDDPLFRSGLLFAGANNTWTGKTVEGIEDGILTAYEVSNMYLPNTKLVVLSACETGLGDIHGAEGVYGLQRAFKMAGVENLVMSLWKVPDAETAEFMQEFYKKLFAKQSISDAFYDAQSIMKNKYRSEPYKWAAWVLVQ